jgi:type IV pilus assembly protein PilC
MPVFDYEVVDRAGTTSRGKIEGPDLSALITRFRERGQLVVSLRETAALVASDSTLARINTALGRVFGGVRLSVLVLFTGQLAAMLGAGLHLIRVLNALGAESTDKRFRRVVEDVKNSIMGGSTFADALAAHPTVFSKLYVAVVRAGELSGSLPIVLDTLTIYLEKTAQLRRKVVGAITYPLVILVVAVAIVFILIINIVPIFEGVYARASAKLPPPTLLLLAISRIIRSYTLLTFLVLLLLIVGAYLLVQTPRGRYVFDQLKLRVPIFGSLVQKAIMARVCRTMSVLLQSGIPLIEAMETVATVSANAVIERAIRAASVSVRDGVTIAESLRQAGEFPTMVTQIVATGEESGTLPAMLGKAALYYEQQVDNTVATLSSLIEPIMIVVMGSIVGGVIFALYLPIFGLGQAIRGFK